MLRRQFTQVLFLALAAMTLASGRSAYGVNPNPLQDAYWRFEEGIADGFVPAAAPGNEGPGEIQNSVLDSSGNSNHMQAYNSDTAPKYINYSLPPTPLKSGLANTLAWEVDGGPGGGRDTYTNSKDIQNGIVGGMYDTNGTTAGGEIVASTTTAFTLEAAFSVFDYSSFRGIVAKEGRPGSVTGIGDPNLPTLALKVRGAQFEGDPDQGKLQIELFDGQGNLVNLKTDEALTTGQWYYTAVVNDGETLSFYVDSNDGNGYVLEGQTAVDGALFQGLDHDNADWNKNWTVGRAVYGGIPDGSPADFFNGLIDEVRLSNEALDPSEFLFAQEPTELAGDFNGDDVVDGLDILTWQRGETDPDLSPAQLQDWKDNFGTGATATAVAAAVPEPASLALSAMVVGAGLLIRRRPQ